MSHESSGQRRTGPRTGIVGTGFIAGVHARAVRASGGTVSAVLGRTPAGTHEAADRLGADRAARDLDDLLADVDVVHVCTPNASHAALAEAVLAAGRHLVVEKPLATSVADARRIAACADEAGVVACVPFVYRFYASVREARERLAHGAAGPLWMLHGSYLQDWLSSAAETNWRVDPALGGASRAFGDIGVHWCDLMEFTTGHRIVRLSARTAAAFRQRGAEGAPVATEDGAVVAFETDQGAVGSVVVSQVSPGRKNRLWFSFDGPVASYSFDQELPDALWVGGRSESRTVLRDPDRAGAAARFSRLPAGHPQGYQDAFDAFVGDVHAAVRGDKPDGLPLVGDGLRAAVLTEAVVAAAASSTWVEVPA